MENISSNRLAEARKAKGITQQELADRLGVHFVTISKLERGKMQLTADWIVKLASALGVEVSEIFSPPNLKMRVELEGVVQNGFSVRPVKGIESRYILETGDADNEASFWVAVADDAFAPFFHRGDVLRFTAYHETGYANSEGRLGCLTLRDGRTLIAVVENHLGGSLFDVRSTNGQRFQSVDVDQFALLSGAKIKEIEDN